MSARRIRLISVAMGVSVVTLLAVGTSGAGAARYWTNCEIAGFTKSFHVHDVQCGVAHAVVGKALAKGQAHANPNGVVIVDHFRCRVTGVGARPILCVKGAKRIRAPMP